MKDEEIERWQSYLKAHWPYLLDQTYRIALLYHPDSANFPENVENLQVEKKPPELPQGKALETSRAFPSEGTGEPPVDIGDIGLDRVIEGAREKWKSQYGEPAEPGRAGDEPEPPADSRDPVEAESPGLSREQPPPEITREPEETPPAKETVGARLKLKWIDPSFEDSPAFKGLGLGPFELYRIHATYAKVAGRDSLYRYVDMGIAQASLLMERRKAELLRTARKHRIGLIRKMGTSRYSVMRYLQTLKKRGLLIQVARGRPVYPITNRPAYLSRYLVVVSEPQRFKLIMDRKEGKGPGSRR